MQDINQQTQAALGMGEELAPNNPTQPMGNMMDQDYDDDIMVNLENHLDNIPDAQKAFLVDNLNPTTIALLGIVNGKEVYDYFAEIYQTQIAPQQISSNSAVQPNMVNQSTMQQQNSTTQAKATPAGQPVGPL